MTATPAATQLYHFSCPHCLTVLGVPYSAVGQSGPCPCCGNGVMAPPLPSTQWSPEPPAAISSAPYGIAPERAMVPFVAKHVVRASSIELEDNEARKEELRRMRRKRSLYRACNTFVNSAALRWSRRFLTLLLVGFLVFTFYYMKRHKWRPWWVAQDPRELELLQLREAKPSSSPAADPNSLPSLPALATPGMPSHAPIEDLSLTRPSSTPDRLDQAARLTP
jgi:hypothetical protein